MNRNCVICQRPTGSDCVQCMGCARHIAIEQAHRGDYTRAEWVARRAYYPAETGYEEMTNATD